MTALAVTTTAGADTVPIQVPAGALPWTDPNHQSPLETLAAQIANRIAGRPVTIRCEGQTDWDALNHQTGQTGAEGGYVMATWWTLRGVPIAGRGPDISGFAELSPRVCSALQTFALATTKPTKCSQTTTQILDGTTTVTKTKKVRIRVKTGVKGRMTWKWKLVTTSVDVPTQTTTQVLSSPAPCYAKGSQLPTSDPAFWPNYFEYAYAVNTLAHESIHLGGAVGGIINGYPVGDQLAEAHAQCSAMQWIPWVAEQLGDTPDDALALAQWTYDFFYPKLRGTPYWSTDCVPGGAMDIRADKSSVWP